MTIRLLIALLSVATAVSAVSAADARPIVPAPANPASPTPVVPIAGAAAPGQAASEMRIIGASTAACRASAAPVRTWDGDSQPNGRAGGDSAPMRAAELRVFALYGPREFSTFPVHPVGPSTAGETASRGAPLDRQIEDRWLGVDKAKHVAFSFLWTLGTQYVAVNKGRFSEAQALPISVGTSAAVGLSKEYYDLRMGPTQFFSYKDLVADGVGILLAVGVILL